ncbi:MAG TPA: outer membrane protein assembly factor BamA [Candidatus Cloacimonadota bacterium]|nr:outer membrane protein assembly factor BamA [Candidatus Cloacimonadota bacterium]
MSIKHILLCLMLLAATVGLSAYGETIYAIKVEGQKSISPELVTSAIGINVGDALDPEQVAQAIKTLYKMGVFKDIQFHSEVYRTGVNLIIRVVENPVLSHIEFLGLKVVKKDRVDELLNLRVGSFWNEYQKVQVQQKLVKEYQSKGFSNARVTVFENIGEDNRVRVKVEVEEGKRVAIAKISFTGNANIESKALQKRMKTKPASLLRSGRFEQEKFDTDLGNLASYYKQNGYVDVGIGPWELKTINERELELLINIKEGERYILGQIRVEGNTSFTSEAILAQFTLKKGEPFDEAKFEKQLAKVYSMYFDEGYIYTQISHEKIKQEKNLEVVLKVVEGARARIRQIQISGNRRTKEKVIRRQLEIAPGDYYRQSQVIRSQQNIYNLGFFEPDIQLDYTPINNQGDIDLQIDVVDKSSGMANGGVGYNSQDKFVGQLSLSQNNLFGNNWSSSLMWEFGGSTQNFEFSFTNPNLYDSDVLLGTNLYYTEKDWSSFYYKIFTRGASLRLGQYLPWIDRTRLVAGYSLYSKKYRVTNRDKILEDPLANATLIELDSLSWRYTSSLNATVTRDTRDNIFFPTRGSQVTLFSEIAGGLLGGDFDYFKQIMQVNWYAEAWEKLTLRTKWRFGYVSPYGKSDDAPPDEKFYLGGTGVDGIRGFPDRSIGPAGGGTRAIIFSTELGYPIAGDQIIAVGFFDAGNSFNKMRDFNFLELKKGIGAGIRIRSPFGLIGFDYAHNLNDGGWEPHLQFGTTF